MLADNWKANKIHKYRKEGKVIVYQRQWAIQYFATFFTITFLILGMHINLLLPMYFSNKETIREDGKASKPREKWSLYLNIPQLNKQQIFFSWIYHFTFYMWLTAVLCYKMRKKNLNVEKLKV